jgi:glutaminase
MEINFIKNKKRRRAGREKCDAIGKGVLHNEAHKVLAIYYDYCCLFKTSDLKLMTRMKKNQRTASSKVDIIMGQYDQEYEFPNNF